MRHEISILSADPGREILHFNGYAFPRIRKSKRMTFEVHFIVIFVSMSLLGWNSYSESQLPRSFYLSKCCFLDWNRLYSNRTVFCLHVLRSLLDIFHARKNLVATRWEVLQSQRVSAPVTFDTTGSQVDSKTPLVPLHRNGFICWSSATLGVSKQCWVLAGVSKSVVFLPVIKQMRCS